MTVAFVIAGSGGSSDSNGFTSSGIDTSGANFLFLSLGKLNGTSPTVTDSKSNTWSALTEHQIGGVTDNACFYALNATVGTGHTFTISGSADYPGFAVAAFSGVVTSSALDGQTGATIGTSPSIQTGSITPSVANCLVITGLMARDWTALSIDGGFTKASEKAWTGTSLGAAVGYLIQTTATAANPTWSTTGGSINYWGTTIAVFKPSASVASLKTRKLLLGVGV